MKVVTLKVRLTEERIITSREEIFNFLEKETNIDSVIDNFILSKELQNEAVQSCQKKLKQLVNKIFIKITTDTYLDVENIFSKQNNNVTINCDLRIPSYTDLLELFETEFDYNDYLDEWLLIIAQNNSFFDLTSLINYYQSNPLTAWENVNNISEVLA